MLETLAGKIIFTSITIIFWSKIKYFQEKKENLDFHLSLVLLLASAVDFEDHQLLISLVSSRVQVFIQLKNH